MRYIIALLILSVSVYGQFPHTSGFFDKPSEDDAALDISTNSMMLHFDFDSYFGDGTAITNVGTLTGLNATNGAGAEAITWTSNNVAYFDGGDIAKIAGTQIPQADIRSNFTISVWINCPDHGLTDQYAHWVSMQSGWDANNRIFGARYDTTPSLTFYTGDGAGDYQINGFNPSGADPKSNYWYNITAVHDSTNISLYINSTNKDVDAISFLIPAGLTNNFCIGGIEQTIYQTRIRAYLDDFRVWTNTILTPQQITNVWLTGLSE